MTNVSSGMTLTDTEYKGKHISEIVETLGKRLGKASQSPVCTGYNSRHRHYEHTFMGKRIGTDMSYAEITDVRDAELRSIGDAYREAYRYYLLLRENEHCIRGIDARLYFIRKQIEEAGMNKQKTKR